MAETLERMKQRLADYESGLFQKMDSRGRDITNYEIEDLRHKIASAEAALKGSPDA